MEYKVYNVKEKFTENKNFDGWPFHLADIGVDLVHDDTFVEDINIIELENKIYNIGGYTRQFQQDCLSILKETNKTIKNISDYEDQIFTVCAYEPRITSEAIVPLAEQMSIFNFFGFVSSNFSSNLENRVPMVYIGNNAGMKYLKYIQESLFEYYFGLALNSPNENDNILSFDYDSASVIPWNDFEDILDAKWFSEDIVGAQVTDTNEHNWRIIKVGDNYYDLWYEESIGDYQFNPSKYSKAYCYWKESSLRTNLNGSLFYDNTSKLPAAMKARVIDKEVNAAWIKWDGSYKAGGTNKSIDKVWLLTYTEIAGHTVRPNSDYSTNVQASGNDGEEYEYFKQGIDKRSSTGNGGLVKIGTYSYMWLATTRWNSITSTVRALRVHGYGSFSGSFVDNFFGVVPAVRIA